MRMVSSAGGRLLGWLHRRAASTGREPNAGTNRDPCILFDICAAYPHPGAGG